MRSTSIEAFWKSPVGKCVIGRSYCVGCWDETFRFAALWGRPREDDARAFTELLEVAFHPTMRPPLVALTDVSRLEQADPAGFRVLAEYLHRRRQEFDEILEQQALVRPRDGVVAAVVEGFYNALGSKRSGRTVVTVEEGLAWLGYQAEAKAMAADLRSFIEETIGADAILCALRRRLDEEPRLSLGQLAEELAMTVRALQRHLEQLRPPTRFRDEASAAKLRVAERLLEGNMKISSVARRVGLPLGKLRKFCRESHGKTPAELRVDASSRTDGSAGEEGGRQT